MAVRGTRSSAISRPYLTPSGEWAPPISPFTSEGAAAGDTAIRTLSSRRQSVTVARNFTTETLRDWELGKLCHDVELVVSELVTNALRALGDGWLDELAATAKPSSPLTPPDPKRVVQLKLVRKTRHVMCLVVDPSDEIPCRQQLDDHPDILDLAGRGLCLVEAYSLKWGWAPLSDGGKVVWALFHASE